MGVIEDYIGEFEGETASRLAQVAQVLREEFPDATETIAYRMPTLKVGRANAIHFAGYAHHIGLYPTPEPIVAFASELAGYTSAKGSIQFPHDRPLPLDLIRRIAAHRASGMR